MNELALFSGSGLGLLGTSLVGARPVCAVEKCGKCRRALMQRQKDGVFPFFPIWDDVRSFDGRPFRGLVSIVSAGLPCQPFSVAGKMLGEDDERSLWDDTIRIIREVRPQYIFLENVPNLRNYPLWKKIVGEVSVYVRDNGGGWVRGCRLSARRIGANHLRNRLFLLSYCNSFGGTAGDDAVGRGTGDIVSGSGKGASVAYADCERRTTERHPEAPTENGNTGIASRGEYIRRYDWCDVEPGLDRLVDGGSGRVHRIEAAGQGQVPGVVREVWRVLNDGQCGNIALPK